jgi:pimeloyl-ACP methyl ester carboxylesterase
VLRSAGEQPPFVLVGWSLGASLAYLFASQYRNEVVGLVLLDAAHFPFDFNERLWASLPPDLAQQDRQRTLGFYQQMASPGFLEGGWDAAAIADHIRGTPPVADIPLIVMTAGKPLANPYDRAPASFLGPQPEWPPEFIEMSEQLRLEIQANLAQRIRGGRHVIVDSSDHLMWRFVPGRVTAAVLEVVETVRRR